MKVSIIGAGNVGAACAQRLAEAGVGEIVLVDIIPALAQGKALDILESAPLVGFSGKLIGTSTYQETASSDLVIITSGASRKPGMDRLDLLRLNKSITTEVAGKVAEFSPNAIIIMVTNPVEAMTYLAQGITGWERERVIGLSGLLDGARFSAFVAQELGTSPSEVKTWVLGEHGEGMVVLSRLTTVSGRPLEEMLPPERISQLIERTRNGGAEIVELLKSASASVAPSAAVFRMAESILYDKKEVMTASFYLKGEYGIKDSILSVPLKLGRKGVEGVIELDLNSAEKDALVKAAAKVNQTLTSI